MSTQVSLIDAEPRTSEIMRVALAGLTSDPKTLPCSLLYDQRGSELFDAICELPEYYPTRTEIGIMRRSMGEIAEALGPRVQLIEPGSGAGTKTAILIGGMHDPASYVPIEISRNHLIDATRRIQLAFPTLEVQAICGNYCEPLSIPTAQRATARRVAFFPGSTIGNFSVIEARRFLGQLAAMVGPGGGLLIGADLRKDPDRLVAAYDDSQGVTAEFNRNILHRLNREVGANFAVDRFEHRAVWNDAHSRMEISLVSKTPQRVVLNGVEVSLGRGEGILTEHCHKYGPEGVAHLADRFELVRTWTDDEHLFCVQYMTVPDDRS